jgi:glycosyltransferase involved in cell wall biosynthesis
MNTSTIKAKTLFFIGHINYIGGVETWIHEIAKKYSSERDITLVYKWAAPEQLRRLRKLIRCVEYHNEDIECENFIFCYDMSIIDKVKAKEYILTIHADYKVQNLRIAIPKQTTRVYCVSELARQSFIETHGNQLEKLGLECKVLYNPITIEEPRRVLKLISATRLTKEKGGERMKKMAKRLHDKGIPFTWLVFTDTPSNSEYDEFVYMTPRLDILGYIKDADYLVQLSDTEGYAYSLIESLNLGTPVIVTEIPVAEEMGVKYGENGYILKFDMSNLDEVIDKAYNNNLKGFKYKTKKSEEEYEIVLGEKCKSEYKYIQPDGYDVEVLKESDYTVENIHRKKGEFLIVKSIERLEYLEKLGYVRRI